MAMPPLPGTLTASLTFRRLTLLFGLQLFGLLSRSSVRQWSLLAVVTHPLELGDPGTFVIKLPLEEVKKYDLSDHPLHPCNSLEEIVRGELGLLAVPTGSCKLNLLRSKFPPGAQLGS